MNRMLKCAVTAVIALAFGSAAAQNAPVTGRTVLDYAANPPGFGWGTGVATSTAGTFHAGGVAACDGCHVMHNASNGVARSTRVAPWTNAVPAFLLQGTDQSSTCLICHGGTTTGAGVGSANAYRIANVDAAGAKFEADVTLPRFAHFIDNAQNVFLPGDLVNAAGAEERVDEFSVVDEDAITRRGERAHHLAHD